MLFALSLTVVFLLLLIFQYKWGNVKRYWADRKVPHSQPHPILGGLQFLLRENAGDWMLREYKKHKPNPYFGTWWFWNPILIICDPDYAKKILVTDFNNFSDRLANAAASDVIGSQNLFIGNEPQWSKIRKQLSPVFSTAKLKSLDSMNLGKSKELVQRIQNDTATNKIIDLKEVFVDYSTDVISAAAFGVVDSAVLKNGETAMRKITRQFMNFSMFRAFVWGSVFFFPRVVEFLGFHVFPKSATDYFRKVFTNAVERRGGWQTKNNHINDLLDALIIMKKDAKANGEDIDEEVILAQAVIFLHAGFETTAITITFLVYELAYNKDVQKQLYEEVREAKKKLNGIDFNYESLSKLTYLQCVTKEILRKYPAIGFIERLANDDYKIDDKLSISKGTPVYVNIIGLHKDPEYFPEPHKFDPDRFLPQNEGKIKSFAYLPFGEGPRHCIGSRFGRNTVQYAIAHLILAFEFKPYPGMTKPEKLKFCKKNTQTVPDEPIYVKFVSRN